MRHSPGRTLPGYHYQIPGTSEKNQFGLSRSLEQGLIGNKAPPIGRGARRDFRLAVELADAIVIDEQNAAARRRTEAPRIGECG